MTKTTFLVATLALTSLCNAQKKDTLVIHYASDQYLISKSDQTRIDNFLKQGWDRISVNGFTDETDNEEYNLDLSKKRSKEVYDYLNRKTVPAGAVSYQFFGEANPKGDNNTEEGKALNRRTEIIGYRYAKITPKPTVDLMKPVTKQLDNGFIITYRPGSLPPDMAANFESGSGINFQTISNTAEMRQYGVYNNTTRGEILSSVTIFCAQNMNPCKLDSPVLLRVPVPFNTNCPIEKVKFFNTVVENGKRIWQEQSKSLYPEVIDGIKYVRVWLDNFCECINFDFKLDPDCWDVDSTQVMLVNSKVRNMTVELAGFNSVYIPKMINDSTFSILYLKDKMKGATLSFALYAGKKRIRSFKDQQISTLKQDANGKHYIMSVDTVRLYFPRLRMADAFLKVNKDRYRVVPEKNKYEFIYLTRVEEKRTIDFSIIDRKGKLITFKDQPLTSLKFDESKGCYIIDKDFVKQLKAQQTAAQLQQTSFRQ